MNLPQRVRVVEVAARDGLQNESQILPVSTRIELINRLADSGLREIEAGSFVSPRHVPQMADTDQVLAGIRKRPGCHFPVLVPNRTGLQHAIEAGATDIAIFAAASETFSQRNIGCSITESLQRYAEVATLAHSQSMRIRGYVSCVLGCPYEGNVPMQSVLEVSRQLMDLGCYEVSLGDTVGYGIAAQVQELIDTVAAELGIEHLAVHFHDTRGQALANILQALQMGVSTIDSSIGGLGGCPYAPGASGNVATEKVIYLLDGLGIDSGVDLSSLLAARRFIREQLQQPDFDEFQPVST